MLFKKTEGEIFRKYYYEILNIIKGTAFAKNAEFEIVPAMAMVADYYALKANRDRRETVKSITAQINKQFTNFDFTKLDKRMSLYTEIVNGRELRGDWFLATGDINSIKMDMIGQCVALLADILYFPPCADDYEIKYIAVAPITDTMAFIDTVINKLVKKMGEFAQAIYHL